MATTLLQVLQKSTAFLAQKGSDSARLDAEVLLAHGLGLRRIDLYLQHDRPLDDGELARLRDLVVRRARGVPVAYLVGSREFHSLAFSVSPAVLVPRPETEGLVDAALAALAGRPAPLVAEVGTGSGCVVVSLLHALPAARGLATDTSPAALAVARENAARHRVLDRLDLRQGSGLAPFADDPRLGCLDAVVSNPPYIVRGDPAVEARVVEHEPADALFVPGSDPLEVAALVAREARDALAPGGFLAIEVGAGSGAAARALLEGLGYADVAVDPDLGGIPRVAHGRRPPGEARAAPAVAD